MKNTLSRLVLILVVLFNCIVSFAENNPYRSDVFWVTVPDHADWVYKIGEKAKVEIRLYQYGIPCDVDVIYELGGDEMPADENGKVRLKNGRATINIGTMKQAGFRDCRLTAIIDGKKYQHHVKVGFSPEKLQPYTQLPRDFNDFWNRELSELSKFPLKYKMEKVDKYSTDEVDYYLVRLEINKKQCVYAYLSMPVKSGKYPVVLCPPGAGIKTIKEPTSKIYYAQNGMIRMEMEIHGLNPEISAETFAEISNAFNPSNELGYLSYNLDSKDNYYMKHVYLACIRAIDFLTSLPQWDGKNVVVQGSSQGGALSLVTAGLDKRVNLCVANHPALSDMAGYLDNRAGGYPHFNKNKDMLTPEKVNTLSYYDVVNFARQIKAKTMMSWGYNDNTCPPTTSYIVWNVLTTKKEALVTPINEHWTSDTTNYDQMLWIKQNLKK